MAGIGKLSLLSLLLSKYKIALIALINVSLNYFNINELSAQFSVTYRNLMLLNMDFSANKWEKLIKIKVFLV